MSSQSFVKKFLHLVLFSVGTVKSAIVLMNVAFVHVVTHQILQQMVSCHPGVRELALVGSPW